LLRDEKALVSDEILLRARQSELQKRKAELESQLDKLVDADKAGKDTSDLQKAYDRELKKYSSEREEFIKDRDKFQQDVENLQSKQDRVQLDQFQLVKFVDVDINVSRPAASEPAVPGIQKPQQQIVIQVPAPPIVQTPAAPAPPQPKPEAPQADSGQFIGKWVSRLNGIAYMRVDSGGTGGSGPAPGGEDKFTWTMEGAKIRIKFGDGSGSAYSIDEWRKTYQR
jgi:hypothetical protein